MGARNIVLVGDQMQLGQPIQGVHPGESGTSTLDYLLQEHATIAPERGIFLRSTWRMQESICRFISEAVYDGCLQSAPETQQQAVPRRVKKKALWYSPWCKIIVLSTTYPTCRRSNILRSESSCAPDF